MWAEFIYWLLVWVVVRGYKQYFSMPLGLYLITYLSVLCKEKNRKLHTDKSWEFWGHAEQQRPQMPHAWVGLRLKPSKERTTPLTLSCIFKEAFLKPH